MLQLRAVALSIGVIDLLTVCCLVVFFVVGGPFGTFNDVGNAAVGVLSGVLVLLWHSEWPHTSGRTGVALVAALIGAAIMVIGSVLIISDTTGYFLAGLVSSFGAALIGMWLLAVNADAWRTGLLPRHLAGLGVAAGIVMLLGLLSAWGIAARIDDQQTAPWYVSAGQASFLAIYLLFPIWCLQLARHVRLPAELSS